MKRKKSKSGSISNVHSIAKPSSPFPEVEESNSGSSTTLYSVGDIIEGRFKGKKKWYRGKISKVNNDDTFNILYDDGDKESNVKHQLIRMFDAFGSNSATTVPAPVSTANSNPINSTAASTNSPSATNRRMSSPKSVVTTPPRGSSYPILPIGEEPHSGGAVKDTPPITRADARITAIELSNAAQQEAISSHSVPSPSRVVLSDIFSKKLVPNHLFLSPAKIPKALDANEGIENIVPSSDNSNEPAVIANVISKFTSEKDLSKRLSILKELLAVVPYKSLTLETHTHWIVSVYLNSLD